MMNLLDVEFCYCAPLYHRSRGTLALLRRGFVNVQYFRDVLWVSLSKISCKALWSYKIGKILLKMKVLRQSSCTNTLRHRSFPSCFVRWIQARQLAGCFATSSRKQSKPSRSGGWRHSPAIWKIARSAFRPPKEITSGVP